MTAPTNHVLDVLRGHTRQFYEFAAATADDLHFETAGAVYEQIADMLAAANPSNWTAHPEQLSAAVVADQIAAHLFMALRDTPDCDPVVYDTVQRVHTLMTSLRTTPRRPQQ